MGLAKSDWMESQERGWDAPEKFVCPDCVEDEFLKDCIQGDAEALICDYCDRKSEEPIAAPVETIMHPIGNAFHAHFAEPGAAGVPRDSGEWIMEFTDTTDALLSLPLHCHEDLFEDIAGAFHDYAWVPCADGYWLGEHDSTKWRWSWEHFERIVKKKTRYFFSNDVVHRDEIDEQYTHPAEHLDRIGRMAEELELFRSLDTGTPLYRVREDHAEEVFDTFETLGPPTAEKASAGRMNPAGICYLYLARERRTAIGEVLNRPPCRAAVATFSPKRDMTILDLTSLPEVPSVFEADHYDVREAILFLEEFVNAISLPIAKDGRDHVDYVPSQVVSEFFAQVFRDDENRRVEGMIYPSAVVTGGQNVVIFPPRELTGEWTGLVDMTNVEQLVVDDWSELTAWVSA